MREFFASMVTCCAVSLASLGTAAASNAPSFERRGRRSLRCRYHLVTNGPLMRHSLVLVAPVSFRPSDDVM
jgi:hypothetical protein